jgi:hypothetical protein
LGTDFTALALETTLLGSSDHLRQSSQGACQPHLWRLAAVPTHLSTERSDSSPRHRAKCQCIWHRRECQPFFRVDLHLLDRSAWCQKNASAYPRQARLQAGQAHKLREQLDWRCTFSRPPGSWRPDTTLGRWTATASRLSRCTLLDDWFRWRHILRNDQHVAVLFLAHLPTEPTSSRSMVTFPA